ncbi:uncharacterized protein LOC108741309 [Agrilus planipennis]|uniref:Uncharacterized protein LOC108741309 n=1 Tax=Agrilus planipennis TaxID=224129 RepID=A0A1W4XFM3_AGRPL|nr:uncharacterized protein LOC108741309 [Agrilus planipennis]
MLSSKEKVLQRPWIEKKYRNHRRKVLSAYPAIDNKPPEPRVHVAIKHKKIQKENERCLKIEKDNFLLLKKLCWIMKSNRVDNYWSEPLPNFISRVNINDKSKTKNKKIETENKEKIYLGQNVKCLACALQKEIPISTHEISEERKLPLSLKLRGADIVAQTRKSSVPIFSKKEQVVSKQKKVSKSVPLKKQNSKENAKVSSKMDKHQFSEINRNESVDDLSFKTTTNRTNSKIKLNFENESSKYHNSIVLNKGSLVLSINFPSSTSVKLKDGRNEKILMKEFCGCKNDTKIR